MSILFFDTETTGKWEKKASKDDPIQPHIVQLAAVVTDDDLRELASMNVIVYPYDWVISEEVSKLHGITHARAEEEGVGLTAALDTFATLASMADRFVAHNIEFDEKVIRRAARYIAALRGTEPRDIFGTKELRCTMKAATPVCKLLGHRSAHDKDYKYASLTEAHMHFFGETFDGAHDAMIDVRAMIKVYGKLCEHYGMAP